VDVIWSIGGSFADMEHFHIILQNSMGRVSMDQSPTVPIVFCRHLKDCRRLIENFGEIMRLDGIYPYFGPALSFSC
jgi:hypothetical protein